MTYHIIKGKVWVLNTNVKMNIGNGVAIPELKELPNQEQSDITIYVA